MRQRRHRRGVAARAAGAAIAVATLVLAATLPSFAQDRSVLVRALREGRDFRVRVQAAFALGNMRDPVVRPHLERALNGDSNPAVRAAAATALGRLGSKRALSALRRARRDSSASVRMQAARSIRLLQGEQQEDSPRRRGGGVSVLRPNFAVTPSEGAIPWPRVRYAVWVGEMSNESGFAGEGLAQKLKGAVLHRLRLFRGVAAFDAAEPVDRQARRQIERRRLPKLRFEGNVVKVQRRRVSRDLTVRCEVSLVLLDETERNMRGMLSGAATGAEPRQRNRAEQEKRLAEQALAGAVRSALANAPQALAQASR